MTAAEDALSGWWKPVDLSKGGMGVSAGGQVDWAAAATAADKTNQENIAYNNERAAAIRRLESGAPTNVWADAALAQSSKRFVNENLGTYKGPASLEELNSPEWQATHPTEKPPAPAPTAQEALETDANRAANAAQQNMGSAPAYTPEQAIKDQQMQLAQQIYLRATGQVPSAAELMLRKANQASMRQQLAASASVRGGANQALATRTAQNNMAQASVENAATAAIVRAQEQAQAEGQLGTVLGQMRGQSAQEGQFNAQMDLEFNKFVEARRIQLMSLGMDAHKALLQSQNEALDRGLRSSQFDATLAFNYTQLQEQRRQADINHQFAMQQAEQAQDNADRQFWLQVGSAILSAGSTMGAAALSGKR